MRDDIVLEGAIPAGGIVELLSAIEETCTTGTLHYESVREGSGTVTLVRGQFAEDQTPDRKQRDPVEVLLALREGRFFLQQRLPVLPVTNGDHMVKKGSLAVHVPSELMRYCELAGLTGVLQLSRPPEVVDLAYERGELAEVRVGGAGQIEFEEVFGWEDGRFTIEARRVSARVAAPDSSVYPAQHQPASDTDRGSEREARTTTRDPGEPTEATFLRVVEMSLEDLLRERAERTPAARTGPVIPALPAARVSQRPAPKTLGSSSTPVRGESTVRVIYLAAERSPAEEERLPAMDLNVPLPGEGRRSPSKTDIPRNTAISALDDAGRLRQSKWPAALARPSREDEEITTQFDTASHAALDIGTNPTMLAGALDLASDDLPLDSPRKAQHMSDTRTSGASPESPAAGRTVTPPDTLGTLKWVAFACLVLISCLAVLARLPPID
ncbi:MAG: hypothetical protein R3B40_13265 [Polyangiales bacterium]|nr:DUF4388 domain-containing protein [Sandaracinaceae bacterium]